MLDINIIADRIEYYLKLRNLTAYKLAALSGVDGPTISRIANRVHKGVELKTLMPLARALGVTTSHLTGELGINEGEAVAAVRHNKDIAAAAVTMTHMDEPTRAQYVKIGSALAQPAGKASSQ